MISAIANTQQPEKEKSIEAYHPTRNENLK